MVSQPNQTKTSLGRRCFLGHIGQAIAALSLPLYLPGKVLGIDGVAPSNRVTLGGIGVRHRGSYVLGYFLNHSDLQFVAVSDARRDSRESVKRMVDERYGTNDTAMYRDFREMLERKDIDAVLIATGDRWHTTASVYASNAGKDIYCEKPCAMTMEQCRILDETMTRNGTIFQGGTQRRNVKNYRFACDLARSGKLGKIHTVHASIYYLNYQTNWHEEQPLPDRNDIDWDMWLGPAPWRPFNMRYVDGDWRGHHDFDSGARHLDWGAHTVDLCQMALGRDGTTPVRYWSQGNRMFAEYEDGVKLVMRPDGWLGLGSCPVRFEGEQGWIEAGDSGNSLLSPATLRPGFDFISRKEANNPLSVGECPSDHVRNFIDCVKARKQPTCNSSVIRSSHLACHASALSWILQRELKFDYKTESFIGDDEANRLRSRAMREPWVI